jgi:hypothetical protein
MNYPALVASNVREPRLMLQVERVREILRAHVSVFATERWRCQYSPAYLVAFNHVTEVVGP